jgi:hypothetical protein
MICFGGSRVLSYSARSCGLKSCLVHQRRDRGINGISFDSPSSFGIILLKIHIKDFEMFSDGYG